jgi:hypothetical protein
MYGKTKSSEFLAHQGRKLFGAENPMYGKKKSESTLAKLSRFIYVYDLNDDTKFLGTFQQLNVAENLKCVIIRSKKY